MNPSNDLDQLALRHGSDKFGSHWYTRHYHNAFRDSRDQALHLLEIGIGGYDDPNAGGSSLRMWRDYFPSAQIYGLDYYDKSGVAGDRIKVYRGSQADPCIFTRILEDTPEKKLDIIIDDGSHRSEHVIATFMMMFQYVADGGWYVIEDTQTSYWPNYGGSATELNNPGTMMAFFKGLVDGVNWQEIHRPNYAANFFDMNILSIQFVHNMIFIRRGDNTAPSNVLVHNRLPV